MSHTGGWREKAGLENTKKEKELERICESQRNTAQAQSKVLASFLLHLSGLVPTCWTCTDTSGCETGGLGNNQDGKHCGVDRTCVLAGPLLLALTGLPRALQCGSRGLSIKQVGSEMGREATWRWPHRMKGTLHRVPRHLVVRECDDMELRGDLSTWRPRRKPGGSFYYQPPVNLSLGIWSVTISHLNRWQCWDSVVQKTIT